MLQRTLGTLSIFYFHFPHKADYFYTVSIFVQFEWWLVVGPCFLKLFLVLPIYIYLHHFRFPQLLCRPTLLFYKPLPVNIWFYNLYIFIVYIVFCVCYLWNSWLSVIYGSFEIAGTTVAYFYGVSIKDFTQFVIFGKFLSSNLKNVFPMLDFTSKLNGWLGVLNHMIFLFRLVCRIGWCFGVWDSILVVSFINSLSYRFFFSS